ncbi:MAG: undecaprenyl-diphosphatase UppP [Minisyncoccia bacterium]
MLDLIILGFTEGITEFLPISSSGHLILIRDILGMKTNFDLSFDAVLQLATGLALVVYFWKDIWNLIKTFFSFLTFRRRSGSIPSVIESETKQSRTLILAIILGTIPAVVGGLLLQKQMDTIFRNLHLVAYVLIAGSIVMYLAELYSKHLSVLSTSPVIASEDGAIQSSLTIKKGIAIGFFQCLSLLPGFSRSGATISGGLFMGLTREQAARFSFLLSIPIIIGSGLLKLFELIHSHELGGLGLPLLVGSLVAFVTGLVVVHYLLRFLKSHKLNVFVYYRVILAILILILL